MYSRIILNFIIFLLPTQLGLHFWPSFSRVAGIRLDYLSPTFYLTDIFLLLYLLLNLPKISKFLAQYPQYLILNTVYIILNTCLSISPLNSLFWWLRTLLYILFAISLKLNQVKIKDILKSLTYSVILVISIQIFQFLKQGSLDGIFRYLGERHFTFDTPNLARISFFGRELLRVPSLFSHPNSLAGFLLISLFLIQNTIYKILIPVGLLLTFSKSALLALVIYFFFSKHSKSIILLSITISLLVLTFVPYTIYHIPFAKELPYSLTSRLDLITQTHTIIAKYPLLGVGLGNFVPALAQELPGSHLTVEHLQPVHNIFLLLLTELGYLGFVPMIYILIKQLRINNQELITLLTLVSVTGFFDHYWLTLPQNRLLLALLLGIL